MSSVYWTMVHVVPKKSKKKIIHSERNTMYDERVHVPLGNIDHCNKVIFSLRIFCTYLKIRHNVHKFGYLIEWKSIQFVIQSVFRSFNKTLWCGHKKEQLNLFTFSLIFFWSFGPFGKNNHFIMEQLYTWCWQWLSRSILPL